MSIESAHVCRGGAERWCARVTAKLTGQSARLPPAACSVAIGILGGRELVICRVEERERFGARHVGQSKYAPEVSRGVLLVAV